VVLAAFSENVDEAVRTGKHLTIAMSVNVVKDIQDSHWSRPQATLAPSPILMY